MSRCILFDLDGTLIDTAPDMADALNRLRVENELAPLPFEVLRPVVSMGARGLIDVGFGVQPDDRRFETLRNRFLALYRQRLCVQSRLFDGMAEALATLELHGRVWGIVTNKPGALTAPLVAALDLAARACCVVSGDSAARAKPHPDPLLLACKLARVDPGECIYVGDSNRDMQAGKSAGMRTLAAAYGYIPNGDAAHLWDADGLLESPSELLPWLDANA